MDGRRFDELTRALGAPENRRRFLKGLLGAGLAAVGLGRLSGSEADAQVTQVYCGNQACASNPGGCKPGCVCCTYTNSVGQVTNSRCRPPGTCSPGTITCPAGKFADPGLGCVDCLSAANCPGPIDGNTCLVAACTQGRCGLQPGNAGATCAAPTCSSGSVTTYACNASGTCTANTPTACDPFLCADDGTGCRTTCTDDLQCVPGAFCNGSVCVGDLGPGSSCTRANQCRSGLFCTNGVCCSQESCGNCQVCGSGGTCVAAETGTLCTPTSGCFRTGRCLPGGNCIGTEDGFCEPRECNVVNCTPGGCIAQPTPGAACGPAGECSSMVCSSFGSCTSQSVSDGTSCSGGTECNPKVCISGICQTVPGRANGGSCSGGICKDGVCCLGATNADRSCPYDAAVCCATEQCCGPRGCCDECFMGRGATGEDEFTCCPSANLCPANDPNASSCCFGDETCFQHASGSSSCIRSALICGGTTVCEDACCGNNCCAANQYCTTALTCAAIPTGTCTADDQCGAGLTCVGIEREFGENGPVIVTEGTCCPSNRVCTDPDSGGPFGPATSCAAYGTRCAFDGTTCSYAYLLSCPQPATSCLCSPRGGRTRL